MRVAFLLYEGFTALDWVGPYDVLVTLPDVEPLLVAERAGPVRDKAGAIEVSASHSFEQVREPDVLVVPGGLGNRVLLDHEPLLAWIRAVHASAQWTTSVCTGSLLLAAAGLLDGVPATTHWRERDLLASLGAKPVPDRVVEHGKLITAAGVSAGIDMALRLVELTHGERAAASAQLAIEYDHGPYATR